MSWGISHISWDKLFLFLLILFISFNLHIDLNSFMSINSFISNRSHLMGYNFFSFPSHFLFSEDKLFPMIYHSPFPNDK